ncbi:hypothetical protein SSPIM334S_02707 [Streptomyces spiroverticillatus]
MGAARLSQLNRWRAQDRSGDLVDLFLQHSAPPLEEETGSRDDFRDRLAADIRRPGFTMVVAETDDLVGCAFGFPVPGDGSWWHGFRGTLPRSVYQLTVSQNVFAVSHILVRPHAQDGVLVRRMQEHLLACRQATLGVTAIAAEDRAALAAFRTWGWQDLGRLRRPQATAPLRVLGLPLGERTVQRLGEDIGPSTARGVE